MAVCTATLSQAQTYFNLATSNYSEGFSTIATWPALGTTGNTASNSFSGLSVDATGTIPSATRITTATTAFSTGTSGGAQIGTGNIQLLSTGATANSSSTGIDLNLDFTGRMSGNLSFEAATVFNSTGDRAGSLRVYFSTNGTSWTEITGTNLPYVATNNAAGSAAINAPIPAAVNGSSQVKLRFYYHNSSGGTTGSRPKIAIDNVSVATESAPVDSTSPSLVSVNPADGTTGILPASNLTVTYDENIVQNDGGSVIIKNGASVVETITLPSTRVTISGPTATINPATVLSPSTAYTVIFGGQPFKDLAGNLAPVLTDETFWNFTTQALPSVVINQYYEGTDLNRYIELKNLTSSPVSLAGYRLTVWSNTSPSSNQGWKSGTGTTDREVIFADLTTVPTIPANSTFLIANPSATAPGYAANSANLKSTNVQSATFFDGDDSVVLYLGTTNEQANVVDAVSVVGSEATNTSFYRLTDTPAFNFEIGSKLTDDLGQAWQQIDLASVDAATSANPFYLQAYIDPVPPVLAGFSIGNGAATAVTPRVTLNFTSTGGIPTEYQVSESSDFTGALWTAMPGGAPVIELSSGNGAKTLYFKIRNAFGESTASIDTITRANFTNAGPVIFTQYYEGTSNNKYVEITNISSSPVDLSTWNLVRWGNAEAENWKISNVPSGSSSGVLNLSGILAAGQTVVLSNNQAAIPVAAGSAFISSSIINHTGNDSFGLYEGSVATENLRDALSFTNAGNEGADKSFVRISSGTGFDFTAGTNITGFGTVWQEVTLAVVNAATSNQKEFLGTYLDTVLEDYAAWIDSFFENSTDPNTIGFGADPDFDGIANGIEALIGGNPNAPGVFATTELTRTGNVFTFLYPQDKSVPVGVTAAYEWSTDLANWQGTGESFGGVTVTLTEVLWDEDDPEVDIYQVTATVTAGTATKLFVRVLAEN